MMQWFGPFAFAPLCATEPRTDPPIGASCIWCEELIAEGDSGFLNPHTWHLECFLRNLVGGANHIKGVCTCCGGTEPPDPPGMSRRDAAREAVKLKLRDKIARALPSERPR